MKRHLGKHINLQFLSFQSLLIGRIPMNFNGMLLCTLPFHIQAIFVFQSLILCLDFFINPSFQGLIY